MPGSSCPSATRLTEAEVAWLDNLSHAAHEVTGPVQCELEAGHPGRHVALAQADDIGGADGPEINYWAWWADSSGRVQAAMLLVAGQSAKVVSEVHGHSTMQALAAYVSRIKQLTAGKRGLLGKVRTRI